MGEVVAYGGLNYLSIFKLIISLRPRGNRRHFADDIFKCIFLNENVWISIEISLKFVPKGPINNIPAWLIHRRIYASLGLNELYNWAHD